MSLIISAPFGNYLRWPGAVSTLGTFTLHKRAGVLKRWWRVLKTVRFMRGSCINQLGLPSPGIAALGDHTGCIVSLHGFHRAEWRELFVAAKVKGCTWIELNLSCPNVDKISIGNAATAASYAMDYQWNVTAKVGPIDCQPLVSELRMAGICSFHLCNTIPTPYGGVSGAALKPFSLKAVEWTRAKYPEVHIIGGGGVKTVQDAKDYISAGANDVAIGSALFNPFRCREVTRIAEYLK